MTLSKLSGGKHTEALETVGSNTGQIHSFFYDYLASEEVGYWWAKEHLCEITKMDCDSAIAGFQWKPYGESLTSPAGRGILKFLSEFTIGDDVNDVDDNDDKTAPTTASVPSIGATSTTVATTNTNEEKIKVLFMTRNPIDVLISSAKHKGTHVSAHCPPNDTECLRNHDSARGKIILPTDAFKNVLQSMVDDSNVIEWTLVENGIVYHCMMYEHCMKAVRVMMLT